MKDDKKPSSVVVASQRHDAKPEVDKAKPEERLSDDDLKVVTGGTGKRDLYHKRLTSGTERSAL